MSLQTLRVMNDYYNQHDIPQPVPPQCPVHRCLVGQKALVTGATSGIGKAIAVMLAQAGADVCVNYVSGEDRATAVVEEIHEKGARAFPFRADVSSEGDVTAMIEAAVERFGALDILVCNAGVQKDAPFEEMTVEHFDTVMSIDLRGQFLCAREAVKVFKHQGVRDGISCSAGKILSISSVHDIIPWAGHANYAASKGGVSMLIKSVAQEEARYRIRANIISPGAIRTPINEQAWQTPRAYAELMKKVPYKRIGEPADVARCAVWLVSDKSDYVNGATLYVDGGMTLYPGFETGG